MLLHLCYCMFVTVYIITCCNVKELCVSQRSVFVCFAWYRRQQLFICAAWTICSLWWKHSVFFVRYQPIYWVKPKRMETKKHYRPVQPYIWYTLHWQVQGNIWIKFHRKKFHQSIIQIDHYVSCLLNAAQTLPPLCLPFQLHIPSTTQPSHRYCTVNTLTWNVLKYYNSISCNNSLFH
jgi:hypothetical protein